MHKVSCILNGHNEGAQIGHALKSIQENKLSAEKQSIDFELLVVLDSASKETLKTVEAYQIKDMKIAEVNFQDPSKSRNFGVNNATGDFIAFLDGDDLFGSNWIPKAIETSLSTQKKTIVHPEFNYYFSTDGKIKTPHIMKHLSSTDLNFNRFKLASQNLWTVLSLGPRQIYEKFPFKENNKSLGIGFEDWTFNVEVLHAGFHHVTAKKTVHFIREKKSSSVKQNQAKSVSTFVPKDLWISKFPV